MNIQEICKRIKNNWANIVIFIILMGILMVVTYFVDVALFSGWEQMGNYTMYQADVSDTVKLSYPTSAPL